MSGAVEWRLICGTWYADVGPVECIAEPVYNGRSTWGIEGKRMGDEATLEAAQSAAIAAARALLIAALASVPCEPLPTGWRVVVVPPQDVEAQLVEVRTPNDHHGCFALADGSVNIGHAMLAAGVAARGGG